MPRLPKTERNAEIVRLRSAGWSLPQIARYVGVSYQRAWQVATREQERARRKANGGFYALPTAAQTTLRVFLAEPSAGKRARLGWAEVPPPTDAQIAAMSNHDLRMYAQMPGVGLRSLVEVWTLVERLKAEEERRCVSTGGRSPSWSSSSA